MSLDSYADAVCRQNAEPLYFPQIIPLVGTIAALPCTCVALALTVQKLAKAIISHFSEVSDKDRKNLWRDSRDD